jgi:hypothetical protein
VDGQVLREAAAPLSKAGSTIVESIDILMAFAVAPHETQIKSEYQFMKAIAAVGSP